MKPKHAILVALSAVLLASCAKKPVGIVGQEVTYSGGGVQMQGFLAYNGDVEGKRPGILLVHEWWGQNEYVRRRARMLADLGYVALAVDMFGGGKVADNPTEATSFSSEAIRSLDTARERFDAAYRLLRDQPECDSTKIAAIGYCFGGYVVLEMARLGDPLAGVVSFHGSLPPEFPAPAGQVKSKFLICNGAADPFNPPARVEAFKKALDSLGINYTFIDYPGAMHAFTNPDADSLGHLFHLPIAYNGAADSGSWAAMQDFFKKVIPQ